MHEDNAAALALYQGMGFAIVGRRPRYYSDGRAAVLMTREVPEEPQRPKR